MVKLSEIKGERVFDVIADIIDPACNIASDDAVKGLFSRGDGIPDGMSQTDYVMANVRKSVPALMRDHKQDFAAILAATEGVSVSEYLEGLTMPKLLQGVYEIMTDEDLLAFLS